MKIEVTKGVNLFVQDWGRGKPIVFVHGWPYGHRIFEYQMMQLAKKGYRAVGIDLRGYGYSERPWEGNDYDTWAEDIGRVGLLPARGDVRYLGVPAAALSVEQRVARGLVLVPERRELFAAMSVAVGVSSEASSTTGSWVNAEAVATCEPPTCRHATAVPSLVYVTSRGSREGSSARAAVR